MWGIGPHELVIGGVAGLISIVIGVGLVASTAWRRLTQGKRVDAARCVDCDLPLSPRAVECSHCGRPGPPESPPSGKGRRIAGLLRPAHFLVALPALLAVAVVVTPSDLVSFALAASLLLSIYGIPVAFLEWLAWRGTHGRPTPLRPCATCGQGLSPRAAKCPRCGASVHGVA